MACTVGAFFDSRIGNQSSSMRETQALEVAEYNMADKPCSRCLSEDFNYGTNNQAVFHSGIVSELSIGFLFNMIEDIVCYMGQLIFLSCHNFINVSHNLIRICFMETQSWK